METRLAELVAGLCVVSDLGRGLTDGQGIRSCLLAMDIASALEVDTSVRESVFWVGLLRFVGCTATASEVAAALGDEVAVSARFADADPRDVRDVTRRTIRLVGARPDRVLTFLVRAPGVIRMHETASCDVAQTVAGVLGLPGAQAALGQVFERTDGHGNPGLVRGEQLDPAVRLWQVAHQADLLSAVLESHDVAAVLRARAGSALDADVAHAVADRLPALLGDRRTPGVEALLAAEPGRPRTVADADLDTVLGVYGLLADAKSPRFRGHSTRVAALAGDAAVVAGHDEDTVRRVRRAGLVHDVGKVAVSSRVWNAAGPLTDGEQEQVRLHPYFTERALARVPALGPLVDLAASHHERLDGRGYHRMLTELDPLSALLAAADARDTGDETAGLLPPDAVEAVRVAAGEPPATRRPSACPLTDRERAVLTLAADGLTNRAIGSRLGISPKTVSAHLEHVHAKLGVQTRVAAAMVATRAGWI